MRESIGSTFLYNIIFVYIVIVFGLITATLSYYKAYKINERILYSIDKFEGYNYNVDIKGKAFGSMVEIDNILTSLGYTNSGVGIQNSCPDKENTKKIINDRSSFLYCVYYFSDDRGASEKAIFNRNEKPIYYNYSVISYIYVNLPIVGNFKIPVYTKGERIYNFSDSQSQKEVRG